MVGRQRRGRPVPENSGFIRRRDDSKRGWLALGTPLRNILHESPGDDAYAPTEFPAVRSKRNVMSDYDETQWPAPNKYPVSKVMGKTRAKEKFMLTNGDIIDLCYTNRPLFIPAKKKTVIMKEYLCRQLERRAWEKFGGPLGMKKARELRDMRRGARGHANKPARRAAHAAATNEVAIATQGLSTETEVNSDSDVSFDAPPTTRPTSPRSGSTSSIIEVLDATVQVKKRKSLGFLDLTVSDNEDDKDTMSMSRGEPEIIDLT